MRLRRALRGFDSRSAKSNRLVTKPIRVAARAPQPASQLAAPTRNHVKAYFRHSHELGVARGLVSRAAGVQMLCNSPLVAGALEDQT